MEKGKRWPRILLVILIIAACLAAVVYALFNQLYDSTHYVKDEDITFNREALSESVIEWESGISAELPAETAETESSTETASAKGIYHLMLLGTDTRQGELGNTDAMVLMTVNDYAKKIFFVSFMRDLYAEIPEVGVRKLNSAYAIGGGPLLLKTLRLNYGVNARQYICVNFDSMAKIVDAAGGIDIMLSPDETITANDYITSMAEELDYDPEDYYLEVYDENETMHLNGVQAVAYSRIRYVGNSDYERTERQRQVLTRVIAKLSEMNVTQTADLATQLMPSMTHNLTQMNILRLLAMVPKFSEYEIVTDRIPYDDMYTVENEILIPDMEATREKLKKMLYAKQ